MASCEGNTRHEDQSAVQQTGNAKLLHPGRVHCSMLCECNIRPQCLDMQGVRFKTFCCQRARLIMSNLASCESLRVQSQAAVNNNSTQRQCEPPCACHHQSSTAQCVHSVFTVLPSFRRAEWDVLLST
jgi:hypothetical protein